MISSLAQELIAGEGAPGPSAGFAVDTRKRWPLLPPGLIAGAGGLHPGLGHRPPSGRGRH